MVELKRIDVDGVTMAYREEGQGAPILFLHGNPTSSYLWRNVLPHVEGLGRVIAPDLVGMGASDKLLDPGPGSYRFVEHARYLDGFIDAVIGTEERIVLVVHDWGSALGFHWAKRHPERVAGIAFMEAIVAPVPSWDAWPEDAREIFRAFRSPKGEELVLQKNVFVENVLPGSIERQLTPEEMDAYRAPFREPGEDRRPTLTWPREIPIEGEPADVAAIVTAYAEWLKRSDVPKLFVNAEPGAILRGGLRDLVRSWPNLSEVTVAGIHFIQEDSPDEIGRAIADWITREVRGS